MAGWEIIKSAEYAVREFAVRWEGDFCND